MILLDVVDICPPGFETSHSGCHFAPGITEIVVCAGCTGLIGAAIVGGLIFALRRGRASGSREGTPPPAPPR